MYCGLVPSHWIERLFARKLRSSRFDLGSRYSHRSYNKALGDVTLADAIDGTTERILQRRRELKALTMERPSQPDHL